MRDRAARGRPYQRIIAPRKHRHILADHVENNQGIAGGTIERDVAGDRREGFHLGPRIGTGQHDRMRIVNARVSINHNAVHVRSCMDFERQDLVCWAVVTAPIYHTACKSANKNNRTPARGCSGTHSTPSTHQSVLYLPAIYIANSATSL